MKKEAIKKSKSIKSEFSANEWRNRIVETGTRPAKDFLANPLNARRHPNAQRDTIRGLLGELGWITGVIENKRTGNLIDGHLRIEEALSRDENEPIPYTLVDLSEVEEKLALASFDPVSALATIDRETLDLLLHDVSTGNTAVMGMLSDLAEKNGVIPPDEMLRNPEDAVPLIDRAEELNQKWQVKPGDLWQIGEHRLLCGDATSVVDVERLLGGGSPQIMVTDPPYGVKYDPSWRDAQPIKGSFGARSVMTGKVENDDRAEWGQAWLLFPGEVIYCWHAGVRSSVVQRSLEAAGYQIRSQIIWVKNHFALSRGYYHWQHEPCWFAIKKGAQGSWIGGRDQSTVWEIKSMNALGGGGEEEKLGHATQKPLECMLRPIRNHSGDVYDPFAGSGTTIVACQKLERRCYAMEIFPPYVAMILERTMSTFPDIEIKRIE